MTSWRKIKLVAMAAGVLAGMVLLAACNYSGLDTDKSNAELLMEAVASTRAAKSYHLTIDSTGANGQTSRTTGDVDTANGKLKLEVAASGQTTQYIKAGGDLFISDDGGQSFYKSGDPGSGGDNSSTSMLAGLAGPLDSFRPEEASKAENDLRNGNPFVETIDGVATKHVVAGYKAIPSLVTPAWPVAAGTPGTVEMWLTLGDRPTVRRLKLLAAGAGKGASLTLDWSKLDEPVAIDTPQVIQASNINLLKKAVEDMQQAGSYELDADITQNNQAVKLNSRIDVNNNNATMDIVVDGQTLKLITVDGTDYISMDDGKTYLQSDLGGAFSSNFDNFTGLWDSFNPDQIGTTKRPIRIGNPRTEKIGGVLTRHITVDSSPLASMQSGSTGSVTSGKLDLWISTDARPYVYQMAIDSTVGGQTVLATLKWSRFDQSFDIAAPPAAKLPAPTPTAVAVDDVPRIPLADFKALYDDPAKRPLIIDVRTKDLYDAGHIAGALSFPEATVDARVAELPKDRLIIAYCQ